MASCIFLLNPLSFLKNVNDSDNNHALKIKVGKIIKKSKKNREKPLFLYIVKSATWKTIYITWTDFISSKKNGLYL